MAKRARLSFEQPYDNIVALTTDKTRKTYLGPIITTEFENCYTQCISYLSGLVRKSLTSNITGKTYFAFISGKKKSRPVNVTLFNNANLPVGLSSSGNPLDKVDILFQNIKNGNIAAQNATDITEAIYRIVMSFACCTDLFSKSGVKQVGTYFEKLIGHLYATHLQLEPEKTLSTISIDNINGKIPADFVFNTGVNKPKYHVPAKFSSRDRSVQVWAQQRLIDGSYGTGRFHCLLTCCNETDFNNNKVTEVCVAGQWTNYQLYIAQILRAYYLDLPDAYAKLSFSYPPIHAKNFGEFFHESATLVP